MQAKMEDFERTQSTATSGFKNVRRIKTIGGDTDLPKSFEEPLRNQSGEKKYHQYLILSGKTNTITLELQRLNELHNRMSESKSIAEAEHINLQKYDELSKCNKEVEKEIKNRINQLANKVDKEIQDLFRVRTNHYKETDKIIKDEIEQLKEEKEKTFTNLTKETKTRFEDITAKAAQLRKETLAHKKENSTFRQDVFGVLNSVRAKLITQVNEEESRRKTYDEIIQNLLEKSCTKAEQSLRRKLY